MNTQSNFVGVFTLKTQEEVAQLANAVHRLVQRSVEIFHLISTGKAHEIRGYMDTINSVAPSFVDLTLDENEKNRVVAILNALSQAQSSLNPYLGYQSLNVDEGMRETVKVNMAKFLEKVADLCDMMEENQTNRGVQTVQQALRYVEILSGERPASEIFIPKVNNATNSFGPVNHLLENRISVTEEGELRETLRQLRDRLRSLGNDLTSTCKSLHQEPRNEGLGAKYKGIVVELVELLNKALNMVQGNEVKIKGTSAFSNEHLNSALSALGDAVRSHDKDLAAENARNLVKEVQNADSPALKAKTKEVVQATINALGDDDKQSELDRAMAELKELAAAVECGGTPGGSTIGNSGLRLALLNASKDLSHKVEDVFSPRNERFNHLN